MLRLRPRPGVTLYRAAFSPAYPFPFIFMSNHNKEITMTTPIARAAIHVGNDKKFFSAQVGNEAERRGWTEETYRQKNADKDKNNHYNFSRKHLNFEIVKGGKFAPLGSNPVPLHKRIQRRLDELGFKPYMEAKHPDQVSKNSPNCTVSMIFSGDHEVLHRLAFGGQQIDTSDSDADHRKVHLQRGIFDWAKDTYDFACRRWGEENIISFAVHCDETSIHAHVQTIPVEKVKKRGRIGSQYVKKDNPNIVLSTKEWKDLPKEERADYDKQTASKTEVERVSYAKVWGETRKEKSEYLSRLHTDYHNEVGKKYGLARGIPYDELTEEEKRGRRHKSKVVLEAERQARLAIAEAVKEKNEIEAETTTLTQQKEEAKKDLETAQSGFIAKIFQPGKYKKEEANKLKEAHDAGVKETLDTICKSSNLKFASEPTAESLGHILHTLWNDKKELQTKLSEKNGIVAEKELKIKDLNAKVTLVTEEVNGLKHLLTLIDASAVEKLRNDKAAETNRADKAERELRALQSEHTKLQNKWNALWIEPEFNEAAKNVKARKEREARLAEEAKREEEARQTKCQNILNRFVKEGRDALATFSQTDRINFTDQEKNSISYGILAAATKHNISLGDSESIDYAVDEFLEGMPWKGCTQLRADCISNWTKLFAAKEVEWTESAVKDFVSLVDHLSCSGNTYVSAGGSNGAADQLTNWDGTQKIGLGAVPKKKNSNGMSM